MWFRLLWPVTMLGLFLTTLALAGAAFPEMRSPWLGLAAFVVLGVPFALFANWWGPLLFYKGRVRRRAAWCEHEGFVRLPASRWPGWMGELRELFRRPEKGIVLAVFQGGRLSVVDYAYLHRYGSGRPHEGGVEAREGVTVVIGALGADLPRISVEPKPLGHGLLRTLIQQQLGGMGLEGLLSGGVKTGDPSFDQAFVVTAADPNEARALLNERVRRCFYRGGKLHLHVRGEHLFVHRDALLNRRELADLLAVATELLSELKQAKTEGVADRVTG